MTARCDRFEREGAAALERGELDEAHVAGCADCREARARHDRLGAAIRVSAAGLAPRPGWQARIAAEIARRERARRWVFAGVGTALAAAAVVAIVLLRSTSSPPSVALVTFAARVERGTGALRGESPRPGDRLVLDASSLAGARPHLEIRVYRGAGELVLRCIRGQAAPLCRTDGDRLEAELVLPSAGRYRALALASSTPPPATAGTLDDDVAAARRAGTEVVLGDPFDVR